MAQKPAPAKKPTAQKPAPAASTRRRIIDEEDETKADVAAATATQEDKGDPDAAATGAAAAADPTAPPAVDKKDSVIVNVPRAFRLRIDSHKVINYPKGAYSMHKDHASHWFSVASGVTVVE